MGTATAIVITCTFIAVLKTNVTHKSSKLLDPQKKRPSRALFFVGLKVCLPCGTRFFQLALSVILVITIVAATPAKPRRIWNYDFCSLNQFGPEISQGRPGNEDRRYRRKNAERNKKSNDVAAFCRLEETICCFHNSPAWFGVGLGLNFLPA